MHMHMRRLLSLVLIVPLTLLLTACPNLASSARDTSAALQGLIVAAQAKYQSTCTATPSQAVCVDINKAVSGENALVTATEAYCNWSTTSPPTDTTVPCVPVQSAAAGLQTAISNANTLINEIKGTL